MHRIKRSTRFPLTPLILVAVTVGLLFPSSASGADGSDLVVTLTTDRTVYPHAEPVWLTVSKCNPTNEPISVVEACPCCHFDLSIFDSSGLEVVHYSPGCIQVVQTITWQPGECKSETYEWFQTPGTFGPATGPFVDAGTYSALYRWQFPTFMTEAISPDFEIAPPAIITTQDIPTLGSSSLLLLTLVLATAGVLAVSGPRK